MAALWKAEEGEDRDRWGRERGQRSMGALASWGGQRRAV